MGDLLPFPKTEELIKRQNFRLKETWGDFLRAYTENFGMHQLVKSAKIMNRKRREEDEK